MRKAKIICILIIAFVLYSFLQLLSAKKTGKIKDDLPIVLWWTTKFPGEPWKISSCSEEIKCAFTNDRKFKSHDQTKAFLFYGSDFNYLDLPLPRNGDKIAWGLLHEESPRNTPILSHSDALKLFNYSATISRESDVPLTLQYLHNIHDILTMDFFVPTKKKNELLNELASVLYIQSDCETSSNRDAYVKELMKYIKVDSYGKCLNNKKLPNNLSEDYINNLNSESFLKFVSQYKFTISFENGICVDYITEKLWRPLKVGSVPIYMGSPTIRDWLPNTKSAIIAKDFESPKQLAAYLEYLDHHDNEYNSFLEHKLNKKITNLNLIKALEKRSWSVDYEDMKESFVDVFECFVCEKIYDSNNNVKDSPSILSTKDYDCPKPEPSIYSDRKNRIWANE